MFRVETPMDGLHCDVLLDAAARIRELTEENHRLAALADGADLEVVDGLVSRIRELTAPPSEDVVERVALAICCRGKPCLTPDGKCVMDPVHLELAKAAIAAMPDHRARIVAWLRAQYDPADPGVWPCAFTACANAIERGDYLEKPHDL